MPRVAGASARVAVGRRGRSDATVRVLSRCLLARPASGRLDLTPRQPLRGANVAPQEDLVLTAFARAFRTPDLRKKMLFTLGIMALFRLGSVIPTPGVVLRGGPELHRQQAPTPGSTA